MTFLKRISALLICIILMLSLIPAVFAAKPAQESKKAEAPAPKIEPIDEIISSYNNPNGRVLCVASLGNPRLYPENSIEGINSAIAMGADIVTVCVQKTKDNKLVLMSDASLKRMCVNKDDGTTVTGNVSDYTLTELQSKFFLKDGKGGQTAETTKCSVASLEEAIGACKSKVMLMINNGWQYAENINALARTHEACDSIIIRGVKSTEAIKNFISKVGVPVCHISAIHTQDSDVSAKSFVAEALTAGANPVELRSAKKNAAIFKSSVLARFDGTGRAFISTTTQDYCGGRDDLLVEWTDLIERGYSIIETDYPKELVLYIKQIESYRTELTSLIMQAQGLNTSRYTDETSKDLKEKLAEAEKISAMGRVSLNQIDKARYDIQESLDSLTIKTGTEKTGLPTWAIVLIVIGAIIGLLVLTILGLRIMNKTKSKKRKMAKFKNKFKNESPEANEHITTSLADEFADELAIKSAGADDYSYASEDLESDDIATSDEFETETTDEE